MMNEASRILNALSGIRIGVQPEEYEIHAEIARMLGGNEREARDYAEKLLKTKGRINK